MLLGAMLLNPAVPYLELILFAIAGISLVVGLVWIRRITRFSEDSDRSFFRYRRRR